MILQPKMAREPFGEIGRLVAGAGHPQCHRCGGDTRFVEMLEQPIYGEPGKALAQYACKTCDVLIEELRPI